jgi:hypothetical protein
MDGKNDGEENDEVAIMDQGRHSDTEDHGARENKDDCDRP